MPLGVHKRKEKYCVEEPTGKSLGCHDTEEQAHKQLAAIEASKHAQRDLEDGERRAVFTQESVAYVPLSTQGGQACANCVFYHARDDYDTCAIVQDWPAAIQNTGWCNRWEMVPTMSPPMQEEIDMEAEEMLVEEREVKKPGLRERLTHLLTPKPDGSMWDHPTGFRVLDNGNWLGWYSNNFRDYYETIFAEQGFDDYVYRLDSGLIPMPELRGFHVRTTGHGRATKVFRAGHFYIAVGEFYPDTDHEQAYYRANQGKLAMSHGFHYDPEQFIDGVFYAFNTFEVSTLPYEYAGNPYTYFVYGGRSMSTVLAPEVRDFLVELMGEEKASELEQTAEKRGLALEQHGAQYRNYTTRSTEQLTQQIAALNKRLDELQQTAEAQPEPAAVVDTGVTDELTEAVRSLTDRVNQMDAFLKDKFRTQPRASQATQTIVDAQDAQYQTLRQRNDEAKPQKSYVGNLMEAYRGGADAFEPVNLFGGPPMVTPPVVPPATEPPSEGQS